MNEDQVRTELKAIFRKIAPEIEFDAIDLSRPLREQVEIDSMDFFNVVVQLHKATGVNIPDTVLAELGSLGDLIRYVARRAASPGKRVAVN